MTHCIVNVIRGTEDKLGLPQVSSIQGLSAVLDDSVQSVVLDPGEDTPLSVSNCEYHIFSAT